MSLTSQYQHNVGILKDILGLLGRNSAHPFQKLVESLQIRFHHSVLHDLNKTKLLVKRSSEKWSIKLFTYVIFNPAAWTTHGAALPSQEPVAKICMYYSPILPPRAEFGTTATLIHRKLGSTR